MPLDHAHHAITVLTRLAARSPDAERHLLALLDSNLEQLAVPAVDVAVELGAPLDRLLGEALRTRPVPVDVLVEVWSRATDLNELRLVLKDLLLPVLSELDESTACEVLVRGCVLLAVAGRAEEAVALAPRALAAARALTTHFVAQDPARAVAQLAYVYSEAGDGDTARALIAEAVDLASRRLKGEADPLVASLLAMQADYLRETGDTRAVRASCDRAIPYWEDVLTRPDPDVGLVLDRLRDASKLYLSVGETAADAYSGPRFGDYRLNGIMAEDGEIYIGVRQWSTPAALRSLARCRYLRAMSHLLDARPDLARDDLGKIGAIHEEFALTGIADPLRPHSVLATAVYLRWTGDEDDAAAARAAVQAESHDPEALATEACVAPGRPEYFATLLSLVPPDDPLGRALLDGVHVAAMRLRTADRLTDALALHEVVIAADPDSAHHHIAAANTRLRLGDPTNATVAARRAVSLATEPITTVSAYHVLARCQDASGDSDGALHSGARAVADVGAVLDNSPTMAIAVLYAQVSRGGPVPHDVVARLLDDPPTSTGDPAFRLAVLAFGYITGLARSHDPHTSAAYTAFLDLAHQAGPRADPVRSALAWNVVMCFVDTGALTDARTAVTDVAELAATHPGQPPYTIEHGKCAAELMSALWNSGQRQAARDLALTADSALRSTHYLLARQRDLGQPPEEYLQVLAYIQNHR